MSDEHHEQKRLVKNKRRADKRRHERKQETEQKKTNIAVLDMETNPFGCEEDIRPFCAELYFGPDKEHIVIWENDFEKFSQKVYDTIENLDGKYTIYAHNGGRFDWMFLIHLIRGEISFKGRSIMSAKIGDHELRDSFHIIPTKLGSYRKDEFDYSVLTLDKRERHKSEILDYLHSDCCYQFEMVFDFVNRFGRVLSIGQAAFKRIKSLSDVQNLSDGSDEFLRSWFFGGRVECLKGSGEFSGEYKLYDVNSMYPYVMANYKHPIGNTFNECETLNDNTQFLTIECDNYGALVARDEHGSLTANVAHGEFNTTIHEYKTALKYGLIENVKIKSCINFTAKTDFADFVIPLYEKRQETKAKLKTLEAETPEYFEAKRDDLFLKLLLNNGYGKFAQNPRKFKDHFYTKQGEHPKGAMLNEFECVTEDGEVWEIDSDVDDYVLPNHSFTVWKKPSKRLNFNNVATAASITGAARSILLEAIHLADEPIYCDTDSIICRNLPLARQSNSLGEWDCEKELEKIRVAGKKLYGYYGKDGIEIIRSKGVNGLTWSDLGDIVAGIGYKSVNVAPTIKKTGEQIKIERNIRLTTAKDYISRIFLK